MPNTDRAPRVYVPNRGGHNYALAEKFGDLVFITTGRINKGQLARFAQEARRVMEDSEQHDYILVSGLTSVCAICAAVQAHKFPTVNLLIFRKDRYYPHEIVVHEDRGVELPNVS